MKRLKKYKKIIKKRYLPIFYLYKRIILRLKAVLLSDKKFVEVKFLKNFGVKPNLISPKRYNEYVSKILLTPPDPLIEKCVDKFEVQKFVKEKIGEVILNDILGVYSNIKEFKNDFQRLPDQFVIKATHGCGWNFICKNKREISLKELHNTINHWLKSNFYLFQRELIYKNITPRIICEKYLEDESGGLIDYKVHCFRGKPKFVNVITGRFQNMTLNTYDINWNFIDINFSDHYQNNKNLIIKKPEVFAKLIEYSKVLSIDFFYVRVDFYIVYNKIYFGELTFTPGNGSYMFSEEEDLYMGKFFEN